MQNEFAIVLSTVDSRESAQKIAHELVERRLAACVNIVSGVESIYRWKGKIESAQELLLVIKTTSDRFEQVQDALRELHPYELPECVMVKIEQGSAEYLEWLGEGLR
jgi:periplasmic divalent cation tolerance protein